MARQRDVASRIRVLECLYQEQGPLPVVARGEIAVLTEIEKSRLTSLLVTMQQERLVTKPDRRGWQITEEGRDFYLRESDKLPDAEEEPDFGTIDQELVEPGQDLGLKTRPNPVSSNGSWPRPAPQPKPSARTDSHRDKKRQLTSRRRLIPEHGTLAFDIWMQIRVEGGMATTERLQQRFEREDPSVDAATVLATLQQLASEKLIENRKAYPRDPESPKAWWEKAVYVTDKLAA